MEFVTSSTAVATTVRSNDITLFVPLELSRSKWLVTINSPGSEKFSRHTVEGGNGVCLLELLSRSRAKAEQRYGVAIQTVVIQEAGLDGFWIYRLLLASGIESHVVDAGSIAVARLQFGGPRPISIHGVQTLLWMLMAWARGERRVGIVTFAHFTCQPRCALKDRTKENQSFGALDVRAKSTENGLFLASVTMPVEELPLRAISIL